MKAVRLHDDGALRYEDMDAPSIGADEVRVRVRACAVNRLDLDLAAGTAPLGMPRPAVLGLEIAGEVEGTAERVVVSYARVCRRCAFCASGRDNLCHQRASYGVHRPGGYAEHVAADRADLIPIPDALTFEAAAATQIAFSTALHALRSCAGLQQRQSVVVVAAGSGVGTAAIQVARHLGARVIAAASSDWKLERARVLGADLCIRDGTDPPEEVDVVLETTAGPHLARHVEWLRPGGTLVVVGAHGGGVQSIDVAMLFRTERRIIGASRATRAEIREALALVAGGVLQPVVHEALHLSDAPRAHSMLRERSVFGKLVLVP